MTEKKGHGGYREIVDANIEKSINEYFAAKNQNQEIDFQAQEKQAEFVSAALTSEVPISIVNKTNA